MDIYRSLGRKIYQSSGGFAKVVSTIFEPYTVGTVTLLLILSRVQALTKDKVIWLTVAFVVGFLPPFSVLVYEKRQGKISDWFMSRRTQRRDVQLAWILGSGAFTALALVYSLPRLLLAMSLSFFFLGLLITLINFYWKISVHTAIITFAVVCLALTYSAGFAFLLLLILLVAWARIRVGAHTLSQVSAGALLAVIITYLWFYHFGLATF